MTFFLCGLDWFRDQGDSAHIIEDFVVYPCGAPFVDPFDQLRDSPPDRCDGAERAKHGEGQSPETLIKIVFR